MPSTSSSAEARPPRPSATETLASRYRHLFVLPSALTLVLLTVLSSLGLGVVTKGPDWWSAAAESSAASVVVALAVSTALRKVEGGTIASFRRVEAVLMAGQFLWLILVAVGWGAGLATGSQAPLANATLFGTFVVSGLEFLVFSGAFCRGTAVAATSAALHPVVTLLIIVKPTAAGQVLLVAGTGVAALAMVVPFIILLGRHRTSRGNSATELFRAFMKTWAGRDAGDLEAIILDHAEPAEVRTRVMRFQREDGSIFIVLPGVHPGPFYPVGSYNLPGVLSRQFKPLGPVLTLHRPGGHERNLATAEDTSNYASQLGELAQSISPAEAKGVQGPLSAQIGKAFASACAFSGDLLLTLSFSPLGSDDLDPRVEEELGRRAASSGFSASVVDAHNSIGPQQEFPDTDDSGWATLFAGLKEEVPKTFRVAYAHSAEVRFSPGDDMTENGMGLFMLDSGGVKSALVLADSNNAVPGLRKLAAKALEESGFNLFEICTSDSHDLAARGLTVTRGYHALGEGTPVESVASLVVELAKLAESRLAPCKYGSGQLTSTVRVFGAKALEEFAALTQTSSSFAKRYAKWASLSVAALFALSLLL